MASSSSIRLPDLLSLPQAFAEGQSTLSKIRWECNTRRGWDFWKLLSEVLLCWQFLGISLLCSFPTDNFWGFTVREAGKMACAKTNRRLGVNGGFFDCENHVWCSAYQVKPPYLCLLTCSLGFTAWQQVSRGPATPPQVRPDLSTSHVPLLVPIPLVKKYCAIPHSANE